MPASAPSLSPLCPPAPIPDLPAAAGGAGRLRALARLAGLVANAGAAEAVLEEIAAAAAQASGASAAALWVPDPQGGLLELCAASPGGRAGEALPARFAAGQGAVGWVAAHGVPLEVPPAAGPGGPAAPDWLAERGAQAFLALPVPLGGELAAVLGLAGSRPMALAEEDRAFLEAVAGLAGLALRHARLLAESEVRRRAAESLAAMGRIVSEALDPDVVAHRVAHGIRVLLGAQTAVLFEGRPASGELVAVAVAGDVGTSLGEGPVLPPGAGAAGLAVTEGRPVMSRDALADPRLALPSSLRAALEAAPWRAVLALPLEARGEIRGALSVWDRPGRAFSPEELRLAEAFAGQAALALENARVFRAERDRARDLAALVAAGRALGASLDLPRTLERIAAAAAALAGAGLANLLLAREDGHLAWEACAGPLRREFQEQTGQIPIPLGHSFSGQVAASRRSLWVPDMSADPREIYQAFHARHGLRCYLGVPILAGDRLLGVLNIVGRAGGSLAESRRELLEMLAAQAAVAIENARLYGEAQHRRREAEVLAELARHLNATLDMETVLRGVAEGARELCGSEVAAVVLREPGTGRMTLRHTAGGPGPESWPDIEGLDRGPAAGAGGESGPLLAVPIRGEDAVEGALYVANRVPRPFTAREQAILERLADHAAIALRNGRLFAREAAARAAAEASEQRFRDLVQDLDAIVWEMDAATGRFTFVNQRVKAILGIPPAEWLEDASTAERLVHPEDRPRLAALRAAAAAQGQGYELEFRAAAPDGRTVWLRELVRVVRGGAGAPRSLRGIAVDLSARKRAEEILRQREEQVQHAQKMEAVGRLAGGMAHDFNNLMTAILIYGDVLVEGLPPGGPLHQAAVQVRRTAESAAGLVRQLLAMSRRQPLRPRILDLNAVAAELEPILHRLAGDGVALAVVLAPGPQPVQADRGQMEQVIVNLALNARDAMPEGGRLTIRTMPAPLDEAEARRLGAPGAGPHVLLAVEDTGVGMDPGIQARLFEPFFTTKEPGKGTGLGLAIVHGIVQQHGGVIAVESAPGRGTAMRVYLPRASAGDAAPDGLTS